MSGTATIPGAGSDVTAERGAAIPYLAVRDARRAIDWYVRVLGGRVRGEPIAMPDGRIGHAEIELPQGVFYLADEHPEIRVRAPEPEGTPVSLVLTVTDLDATVSEATRSGASLDRGPYEAYGHRNATISDPFGHRWMLQQPLAAAPAGSDAGQGDTAGQDDVGLARDGDVGYASLWVPDAERAAAFYAAVLGWEYAPGHDPRGRQVTGSSPAQGVWGGQPRSTLFCSYVVEDIAAAVARVRAAGGQAADPVRQPYGMIADCTDNQGTRFSLYQSPEPGQGESGGGAGRPAARRDGDIAYITMEVPDSALAREFYGTVLGWQTLPGRVEDGWQVADVAPMTGIAGGRPEATTIPLWQVSDVVAAVSRVRAAGGTASEPQQQPYGLTADCTDDQGTRFYLGQFPG